MLSDKETAEVTPSDVTLRPMGVDVSIYSGFKH